ncbi:hypothetical protein Desca_1451 [Desulfotomaculum nigrificans CO-1-SRB]|uniref:Uncharacterized protein n=1 Tax=Desulfotomaculum nigrificans (strain DSM 14880 / VKM B-2319 / CO-1-SRB) TaxID=868595 RepID=F6B5Y7_DESCC|nr:hypothetical protein [Desulfotomaculum nigrificans]AEF94306.1 hypothetical protein Desca_1451 [Desulfotomaculum nigrificans CO-1-SRB]
MDFRYKGKGDVTHSVSLLISILIRYPEVAKINFDPDRQVLRFTFIYSRVLSEAEINALREKILSSIEVYNLLENKQPQVINLDYKISENLTMIEIQRDVDTLVQEEIALMVELFQQYINKNLVTEEHDQLVDEDLVVQEELIEHMLESVKTKSENKRLYAFREEGRVLVFNK